MAQSPVWVATHLLGGPCPMICRRAVCCRPRRRHCGSPMFPSLIRCRCGPGVPTRRTGRGGGRCCPGGRSTRSPRRRPPRSIGFRLRPTWSEAGTACAPTTSAGRRRPPGCPTTSNHGNRTQAHPTNPGSVSRPPSALPAGHTAHRSDRYLSRGSASNECRLFITRARSWTGPAGCSRRCGPSDSLCCVVAGECPVTPEAPSPA
jgi:hypothetical protein